MPITFWEREALSLNHRPDIPKPALVPCTAKGEKPRLSPHPRLDLKPTLKLKLIPGITTIITMDTPIIIMGIMATLTTDVTGMANKFEKFLQSDTYTKKVGKSWKTDPSDDNGQKKTKQQEHLNKFKIVYTQ